jgi:predicted dehydrogenase
MAMTLKEVLGLGEDRKVRYAIVGLGSISQEAMMPGVEHTGNSKITALVTSDPVKAKELAEKYKVERTYSYDQFNQMLQSGDVDAIYLGTPNWRHAEFAVPALKAGIHVLLEKPIEVSSAQADKILAASRESGAKLMVAYRLHFEPATVAAVERVRSGDLGEVHLFTSTFTQMLDPENHRAQSGWEAGPILDMGPYPINAVRNLFEDEPTELLATGVRHPEAGFGDFDDTVSVILRFPGNRLANFTVSYYGNKLDTYVVAGTKGSLELNPAYMYSKPLEHFEVTGQDEDHRSYKNTDHFGGEMKYFSDCILEGREPEPGGMEGLADLRVIEAIHRSLKSRAWEKVERVTGLTRIRPDQVEELRAQSTPEMVNTSSPARGQEKTPKN